MVFQKEISAKNPLVNILNGLFSTTAKKSYVALVDQGLVSVTNFCTGVLLARLCTKEEYGYYVLAFSLIIFWEGIRNSLVSSPLSVYLPRKTDAERSSYIGSATTIHVLVLLVGWLIYGASAGIVRASGDVTLTRVILATIFAFSGYCSREHVRRIFYAQLKVRRTLWVDGVYCLVQLGSLAMLWNSGRLSTVNALLVLGAAQSAAAALGLLLVGGNISFKDLKLASALFSHWKLGKWLVATALTFYIAYQIYPWFLKYTWGMEAVATLGVCQTLLFLANPFILGVNNILLPKMAHALSAEGVVGLKRVTRKGQLALLVSLGPLAVIVSIFAEPLLELLYKDKYAGNGLLVVVLAADILVRVIAAPFVSALVVMERPETVFYSFIGAMAITLLAGYPLALTWGPMGVAIGFVCANMVAVSIRYFFYRRVTSALLGTAPRPGIE